MILGKATDPIDLSDQLVAIATGESARGSVTVADDGSGYVAGEILTVTSGTAINTDLRTQIEVLTVDTLGEVLTARIYNNGAYATGPTGNLAVTGGSGSGAEFTLTYESNGWTSRHNATYTGGNYDDMAESLDKEVILEGEGGGTDKIFIGWRTFQYPTYDAYYMELQGFFAYDSVLSFKDQNNGSRMWGYHDEPNTTRRSGAYHVMQGTTFDFALNINAYRLILTCMAAAYANTFYLGWGNRYGTDQEYPYPLIVGGNSERWDTGDAWPNVTPNPVAGTVTIRGGLPHPCSVATVGEGPTEIVLPGWTWKTIRNGRAGTLVSDFVTWPYRGSAVVTHLPLADRFLNTSARFLAQNLFSVSSIIPSRAIFPSPAGERWLCPIVVYQVNPAPVTALMEVDGMFAMSAQGGISNWDRIIVNGDYYRTFQNSTFGHDTTFFAIKE